MAEGLKPSLGFDGLLKTYQKQPQPSGKGCPGGCKRPRTAPLARGCTGFASPSGYRNDHHVGQDRRKPSRKRKTCWQEEERGIPDTACVKRIASKRGRPAREDVRKATRYYKYKEQSIGSEHLEVLGEADCPCCWSREGGNKDLRTCTCRLRLRDLQASEKSRLFAEAWKVVLARNLAMKGYGDNDWGHRRRVKLLENTIDFLVAHQHRWKALVTPIKSSTRSASAGVWAAPRNGASTGPKEIDLDVPDLSK